MTHQFFKPQQSNREAFTLHHWDTGSNKPDTILVNGRGRMHDRPQILKPDQPLQKQDPVRHVHQYSKNPLIQLNFQKVYLLLNIKIVFDYITISL